jgi:hypothetical protein
MNRSLWNPDVSERGAALVTLLMVLGLLAVLAVGLMTFSATEIQIAHNQQNHAGALYTVEGGISEIVARMELNPGTNVTVNGSTFDAYIGDDPVNPDPNWRTNVYLQPAADLPAPAGTEFVRATVQPSASWLRYGDTDQGLAPITIEHKWVDLDLDGVRENGELVLYDANRFPAENFEEGIPIEIITVPGHLNGSQRAVRAEVTRIPITVKTTAAISSDRGVDLTGNMSGCGHDHDIDTPAGTKIPACRPWELCANRTLDAAAGCLVAVMTTGDPAETSGSSDLEGFPTWSDTSSANPFYDIEEYLGLTLAQWNDIRNNPDYTSSNDATNMDGIVVVNGDATGGEKFNGNDGTGLIYVDGDMDISGNFRWRGLIYVEGDCKITGTAWILGAMCVRGRTDDAFAAGNSTVLFSRDAVAMYVGRSLRFTTLAWVEM